MKLSEKLNNVINESLELPELPKEIIADYVAQYNYNDMWAAYCTSDRFEEFLKPYNSFRIKFDQFYKNNEEIVDDFLLNVAEYYPEFIEKAKKENTIFNAYVEGMIWNTLENKGYVKQGHIDPDLVPFAVHYDSKRQITDERTNEKSEKFKSTDEAIAECIKLNKEYILQKL